MSFHVVQLGVSGLCDVMGSRKGKGTMGNKISEDAVIAVKLSKFVDLIGLSLGAVLAEDIADEMSGTISDVVADALIACQLPAGTVSNVQMSQL